MLANHRPDLIDCEATSDFSYCCKVVPGRTRSDLMHRINYLKCWVHFWFICENRYASKDILFDHIAKSLD